MPEKETILLVGGGLLMVPAVRIAQELGLTTVVTDRSPEAPGLLIADEAVLLDVYDIQGHRDLARRLAAGGTLRGVFTAGADVELTVAEAADEAGLPGIPPACARITKNKALMRRCFDSSGIANPRWLETDRLEQVRVFAQENGFPFVVKAVDNCASRGTSIVYTDEDLPGALDAAIAASSTHTALLEERFTGNEQSVEILFDGAGKCHFLNIVDRLFRRDGAYAIEIGHVNPSTLDDAARAELFRITLEAANAVGISFGAFKADTIITPHGPRILEVTARLSGGFDCQATTPLSSGRNFIRAAMSVALGRDMDPQDLRHTRHLHAAAIAAFPEPGLVQSFDVSAAEAVPGVDRVVMRVRPGEVIQSYRDCGTRPAFVIATGSTGDEAVANCHAGIRALGIKTLTT